MSRSLYRRDFLNKPGHYQGAHYILELEDDGGYLVLADCNRSIRLELPYYTDDHENTVLKLTILKDVLSAALRHAKRRAPK